MGLSFRVAHGSAGYIFSLIKWGIFRRAMSRLFRASPFRFIPSYELAIYDQRDAAVKNYQNPCFVFHFVDKETAISRMNWAKELIESGGMRSLIKNLGGFDPNKEGIYSDFADGFERKIFN
jgi:hypothetical protein